MTRTAPELSRLLPLHTSAGGRLAFDGCNAHQARIHGGFSVESSVEQRPSAPEVEILPRGQSHCNERDLKRNVNNAILYSSSFVVGKSCFK
ncbi:hypothetical protein AVEN_206136-1 [Araneus ventricosus]|uniref:Uncharacterized protein n=1 Tax=Araneus ventricosus TaxID=182803 RepID=A0A4Y2V7K1_ARAVE|nr:hypothetical protein AVEN_133489-1 [Araneus ventricosus]GBO21282.1 hypothetical protein AVEN_206136-1 [Araneus ventricosus]